jgi:hypothetical protein
VTLGRRGREPAQRSAEDGTVTLAIDACALESATDGANQLCGAWYATLQVEG